VETEELAVIAQLLLHAKDEENIMYNVTLRRFRETTVDGEKKRYCKF
jgi:hypothetical protein